MKLNLWDKILAVFGIETTWQWCVVGCTIGRHSWTVRNEKCRNGTPIVSGGFLIVHKCPSKEFAETLCKDFVEIADKINAEKYGH